MAKTMQRRTEVDDESSKLLQSASAKGDRAEQAAQRGDSPFIDADGDPYVLPTMEQLSELVEGTSIQSLPIMEILKRQLKVTLRAIELAEIAYHAAPRQGTAMALTSMQNLANELMAAMEDRKDPQILCKEIAETVIKPIIYEFVKVLTSEADRKRSSFMSLVPANQANIINHEIRDLVQGVAKGCDTAVEESKKRLEELLGARLKGK